MKRIILSLIVLLILSIIPAFSQGNDKDEKLRDSLEKSRQEELTQQQDELNEQRRRTLNKETTSGSLRLVPDKSLLPDASDSWVLYIFTTGGFSGRGKPTVTLTSDSEYACGETLPLQFQPFDVNLLQPLAQIISKADFTRKDLSINLKNENIFVCNDCYTTNIVLFKREANGKIKTYQNTPDKMKFQTFVENFNLIQQNANNLAICQK